MQTEIPGSECSLELHHCPLCCSEMTAQNVAVSGHIAVEEFCTQPLKRPSKPGRSEQSIIPLTLASEKSYLSKNFGESLKCDRKSFRTARKLVLKVNIC